MKVSYELSYTNANTNPDVHDVFVVAMHFVPYTYTDTYASYRLL